VYAHPVRLRLVGLLRQHEMLTATQAGRLLGESSGSCSFHFRQLAKHGLVEEVPVPGRAKPWRATAQKTTWAADPDDPVALAAERVLSMAVADLYAAKARDWVERRAAESDEWTSAAWTGDRFIVCTAEQLVALRAKLDALFAPFERATSPCADGERLVDVISFAVPLSGRGRSPE
jgi:predicted ArsR family transcriptional regulator